MSKLSVEKLNNLKKSKCFTNKKISELTETPLVTIDRLFAGKSLNPTITLLQKVAKVLECTIDDFIEYDKDSPLANYYENKETAKLAQEIHDNPEYKLLMDATRDLNPEDLKAVIDIANRIKGNYNA